MESAWPPLIEAKRLISGSESNNDMVLEIMVFVFELLLCVDDGE